MVLGDDEADEEDADPGGNSDSGERAAAAAAAAAVAGDKDPTKDEANEEFESEEGNDMQGIEVADDSERHEDDEGNAGREEASATKGVSTGGSEVPPEEEDVGEHHECEWSKDVDDPSSESGEASKE